MINEGALAYWVHTGYSRKDLDEVLRAVDGKFVARIDFLPDRTIGAAISSSVWSKRSGHIPTVCNFMQEVAQVWEGEPLAGSIVIWLGDGMGSWDAHNAKKVPIFAYGRDITDHQTLLMPDPAFLGSRGYVDELQEIRDIEQSLSWQDKKPVVFWRGSSSGHAVEGSDWKNAARIQLALKSKELNNPARLDACISTVPDFGNKDISQRIHDAGIVKGYRPFADFVGYKYQVDIDGYSCAWKSLFLKLSLNSVLLKVQSSKVQWYFDQIIPWVHYLPLRVDLQDLDEKIDWLATHDEQCQQIAASATLLMQQISYSQELKNTAKLISKILMCKRDSNQCYNYSDKYRYKLNFFR